MKMAAELFDEVRLLRNVLVEVGERLHSGESVTLAMRAVLEFLARNGPATVPEVARHRHVSRQHVQVIANRLEAEGLVKPAPNPAHERSALLVLTRAGEQAIHRMTAREERFYAATDFGVGAAEVRAAIEALRRVRAAIQKEER